MHPRRFSILIVCSLALLASACTFADAEGDPWGQVIFEDPSVQLDASERLADSGRLRVGNGFELELESLQLDLTSLRLELAPEGAGIAEFDPANPPPNYSLCHNGHCHHDDGRLVDYEDIAIELASASGVAGAVAHIIDQTATLEGTSSVDITLDANDCPDNCTLPRGQMTRVVLTLGEVRVMGRVFDARGENRLPLDGAPVDIALPGPLEFSTLAEGSIDKQNSGTYRTTPSLTFSGAIFDGMAWSIPSTWESTLGENLREEASFQAPLLLEGE